MATLIIVAAAISLIVSGIQIFCFRKKIKDFIVKYSDTRAWKIYFIRRKYQNLLDKFDKLVADSVFNPNLGTLVTEQFLKMSFGNVENFFINNQIILSNEEMKEVTHRLRHPKVTKHGFLSGNPLKILTLEEAREFTYNSEKKIFEFTSKYFVPASNDLPWLKKNQPQCLNGETIILEEFNKIK